MCEQHLIMMDADHRERPSGIAGILTRVYGLQVRECVLVAGDYRIGNRILVERKTWLDFAQSIVDGRLFRQAARLRKACELPLLLVEGNREIPIPVDIHPHAVRGAISSIALQWQIPVIFSNDPEDSALLLHLIAQQETKSPGLISFRPGSRLKRAEKQRLRVLQGLPSVGPKLAGALLARFHSVERVMTASAEELQEVDGIGKTKAGKIRSVLTEASPSDPRKSKNSEIY